MADYTRNDPQIRVVRPEANGRDADPSAIRHEIEETRDRMSRTIEELGHRLNPHHVTDQVKQNIREATIGRAETMARQAAYRAHDTRQTIVDTIRDNPLPAAMVGIGLGWLFINGRKEEHHHYNSYNAGTAYRGSNWAAGDRATEMQYTSDSIVDRARDHAGNMTGQVQQRAGQVTDQVQQRAGAMADRVQDTASQATDRAREMVTGAADQARSVIGDATERASETMDTVVSQSREMADQLASQTRRNAQRVEDRFQDTLQQSPLAVGAAALALGLAAGLSIPETDTESRLMGGVRDDLIDRAKERAGEYTDRAQRVAGRVVEEVQSTAREAAQEVKSTAREAARDEGLTG